MKEETLTDTGRLVQRFIDQELTGEERVMLLGRLAREQALREQIIDLEQLLLQVDRLPRPAVPRRFVADVMDRIAADTSVWQPASAAASAEQGWMGRLWQPHTLRWNLAGALATATVVVLVVGALIARPGTPVSSDSPGATLTGASNAPVLVRLVVLQPEARTVDVAGDFNGWDPTRTPLEQTATGAWTVTIPLQPGRYEYMFVIDGTQWVADPFAVEQTDDGFGARNAVLDVRPAEAL
jgi:hypothetical protein